MSGDSSGKWDERYRDAGIGGATVARVLSENRHLLPASGRALDLACGLGGNALLLARHGLDTFAWDISSAAIGKLRLCVERQGLPLVAELRDVENEPPESRRFDVIVVSRYLERALAPALIEALRPGGLLFYQTFTRETVDDSGPHNPAYRLAPGELRVLFSVLRLVVYREEGVVGDCSRGFRNEAMLVGMREERS